MSTAPGLNLSDLLREGLRQNFDRPGKTGALNRSQFSDELVLGLVTLGDQASKQAQPALDDQQLRELTTRLIDRVNQTLGEPLRSKEHRFVMSYLELFTEAAWMWNLRLPQAFSVELPDGFDTDTFATEFAHVVL